MGAGQRQQVAVCQPCARAEQPRSVDSLGIGQADVVGPDAWPGQGCATRSSATRPQLACPVSWGSARARRCATAVLGQRASGPNLVTLLRKPLVSGVMLNVPGIDQRDQYVEDVEPGTMSRQLIAQLVPPRSVVTGAAPVRSASKGTPFRTSRLAFVGPNACRESCRGRLHPRSCAGPPAPWRRRARRHRWSGLSHGAPLEDSHQTSRIIRRPVFRGSAASRCTCQYWFRSKRVDHISDALHAFVALQQSGDSAWPIQSTSRGRWIATCSSAQDHRGEIRHLRSTPCSTPSCATLV